MDFLNAAVATLALAGAPLVHAQTTLLVYDPVGGFNSSDELVPAQEDPSIIAGLLRQEGFGIWGNTNVWPVGQIGSASPTIDLTRYVELEITPNQLISITGLTYDRGSYTGDANRAAAIRTSLDGFAADAATLTGIDPTGAQLLDFDLSSLPAITAPITLRIYFYDAPTAGADWVDLRSTAVGGTGLVVTGTTAGPGMNYCGPAVINSSGNSATVSASGSASVAANDLVLRASGLPPAQFGIFVVSDASAFIMGANGSSNGNLCVGGAIGRYSDPGEIFAASSMGEASFPIDLTAIRRPATNVAGMAGETWFFQAWFRDAGGLGSNFTDGLSVTLN